MMEERTVNERIMVVRVRVGKAILNLISLYTPQADTRGGERRVLHCVRKSDARDLGKRDGDAG